MEDEKGCRNYTIVNINSNSLKRDAETIENVINVHSEDGYIFHSIIPKISDGETEGYIILFDNTEAFNK